MSYALFLEKMTQLCEDQLLFESSEHNDDKHRDLINQGKILCDHLKKFRDAGRPAAHKLPRKFLLNRIECMDAYTSIIIPPPLYGGVCPCLKPPRSGAEYDRNVRRVTGVIFNSVYMIQVALVEIQAETLSSQSIHFTDFVAKLTVITTSLEELKTKGDQGVREAARSALLAIAESTDRFLKTYLEHEDLDFKAEAVRRIALTGEMLAEARNLPRKSLVRAQAGLQEIANSCAALSEKRAKKALMEIDDLLETLRISKQKAAAYFDGVRGELLDVINLHENEAEIFTSDTEYKLEDAAKRWKVVKLQSVGRPVASLEEDPPAALQSPGEGNMMDAQRALQQTGRSIEKLGRHMNMEHIKLEGVAGILESGLTKGAEGLVKGVSGAGKLASSGADTVMKVGSKMTSEVSRGLGVDTTPSKPAQKPKNTKK